MNLKVLLLLVLVVGGVYFGISSMADKGRLLSRQQHDHVEVKGEQAGATSVLPELGGVQKKLQKGADNENFLTERKERAATALVETLAPLAVPLLQEDVLAKVELELEDKAKTKDDIVEPALISYRTLFFKDAELLMREDTALENGRIERKELLRVKNHKDPIIRVVKNIMFDDQGQEVEVFKAAMVADKILLQVNGQDAKKQIELLKPIFSKNNIEVLKQIGRSNVFVIKFVSEDLASLPDTISTVLAYSDTVKLAEPDYIYFSEGLVDPKETTQSSETTPLSTPDDTSYAQLWGMGRINAPAAWDIHTGAAVPDADQVVVAIIDSGIQASHEDLAANMWVNSAEIPGNGIDDDNNGFIDDVHGIDTYGEDGDYMKAGSEHGTHVAGTVGAVGDNNIGVTGVAWRVKLMALKFLGDSGGGNASDMLEAYHYVTMMKANGVNIVVERAAHAAGNHI